MAITSNSKLPANKNPNRPAIITALILAGEAIFLLPFIFPRIFRPTILEVFEITNMQLGIAFSVYGIVAILAYLFGGPLADRYPARNLMTAALAGTGLGGIALLTIPSFGLLCVIYGYWGLTTILLFWSPMLRSTRIWGGEQQQGLAFGLLDGGRGFVAASVASLSVAVLAWAMGGADELTVKREGLTRVIWILAAITLVTSAVIWFVIPPRHSRKIAKRGPVLSMTAIRSVGQHRSLWLNAVIVLCAYVAYKATDDFSLYANVVHGEGDVGSARVGALAFWMRPVAAVAAGPAG